MGGTGNTANSFAFRAGIIDVLSLLRIALPHRGTAGFTKEQPAEQMGQIRGFGESPLSGLEFLLGFVKQFAGNEGFMHIGNDDPVLF